MTAFRYAAQLQCHAVGVGVGFHNTFQCYAVIHLLVEFHVASLEEEVPSELAATDKFGSKWLAVHMRKLLSVKRQGHM